eukprot:Ihof_evm2s1058 gene=Ihof_evmTU2s1058
MFAHQGESRSTSKNSSEKELLLVIQRWETWAIEWEQKIERKEHFNSGPSRRVSKYLTKVRTEISTATSSPRLFTFNRVTTSSIRPQLKESRTSTQEIEVVSPSSLKRQ